MKHFKALSRRLQHAHYVHEHTDTENPPDQWKAAPEAGRQGESLEVPLASLILCPPQAIIRTALSLMISCITISHKTANNFRYTF